MAHDHKWPTTTKQTAMSGYRTMSPPYPAKVEEYTSKRGAVMMTAALGRAGSSTLQQQPNYESKYL
jgi:hypothetical protein